MGTQDPTNLESYSQGANDPGDINVPSQTPTDLANPTLADQTVVSQGGDVSASLPQENEVTVNEIEDPSRTDFFTDPNTESQPTNMPANTPQVVNPSAPVSSVSIPVNSTVPSTAIQEANLAQDVSQMPSVSLGKKIAVLSSIIILIVILVLAGLVYGTESGLLKFGLEKSYLKTGVQALWGGVPYDAKSALALSAQKMDALNGYHYEGNINLTFTPESGLISQGLQGLNKSLVLNASNELVGLAAGTFLTVGQDTSATAAVKPKTETNKTEEADLRINVKGDRSSDDQQIVFDITNSLNSNQIIITAIVSNDTLYFQHSGTKETVSKSLINLAASTSTDASSITLPPSSGQSVSSDSSASTRTQVPDNSTPSTTNLNQTLDQTDDLATQAPGKATTESKTETWLALNPSDMGGFKPGKIDLANLANSVIRNEFLGYQTVNNILSASYQIDIDAQKFVEALGITNLGSDLTGSLIKLEVWIGKKDKLINQVSATFNGKASSNKLAGDLQLTYSGFGEGKSITKPATTALLATTMAESWDILTGNVAEKVDLKTPQGRDKVRKSDLKAIKDALSNYFTDNSVYPVSTITDKTNSTTSVLAKALVPKYIDELPIDPSDPTYYYGYRSEDGRNYELTAVLEVSADKDGEKAGDYNIYKLGPTQTPSGRSDGSPSDLLLK